MAVITDTPHTHHVTEVRDSSSGVGLTIGLIMLGLLALALFYYGLPALRGGTSNNISVPDKIDVNLNNPGSVNTPNSGQ